jgi:predicted PurR-regulated permease PerM
MFILVVAMLHFGRELLQPFAIAALFTFLLAPAVSLLQRTRMPRIAAVAITVTVALCVVVALAFVVVSQLDDLRGSLTQYRDNIAAKLSALGGVVASFGESLSSAVTTEPSAIEPLAVRVVTNPSPFAMLGDVVGPLLDPLGTMAIVFVLVLFMLIYLEDLRDRIAYILNVRSVTVTIQATTEVSGRISRYLLMTLLINVTYGIPVSIGLALLGVPNAILWGVLATLLRFIPYVGPWLAASMPIALSFAISPDWGPTVAVIILFLTLELISNNVIEPWVYGSRTGLSPLAVIIAAIFWSWLWGLAGLLLSVPMTLILVVSGRYVRPLRFLYTLFGDGPGLKARARFYQRLVADDADEAARIAEEYLTRRPLLDLYDCVMMPALRSLKFDEAAGWLQPVDASVMRHTLSDFVADMPAVALKSSRRRLRHVHAEEVAQARTANGFDQVEAASVAHAEPIPTAVNELTGLAPVAPPTETEDLPAVAAPTPPRVTFIPAGDESDALVGQMLCELLRPEGIIVDVTGAGLLTSELVRAGLNEAVDVVVVGGFLPGSLVRVRHLVARITGRSLASSSTASLTTRSPSVVVGLWNIRIDDPDDDEDPVRQRATTLSTLLELPSPPITVAVEELADVGAHEVVHTLSQTADAIRSLLRQRALDNAIG